MSRPERKIRIGYYHKNESVGGVGHYIATLIEGLDPARYEPFVYTRDLEGHEAQGFLKRLQALGVTLRFVDEEGVPYRPASHAAGVPEKKTQPSLKSPKTFSWKKILISFVPKFLKTRIYRRNIVRRTQEFFERDGLDILHFNLGFFPMLPSIGQGVARARIPRKVMTVHLLDSSQARKKWISASERKSIHSVIALNQGIEKGLIEHGFSDSQIVIIENGVGTPKIFSAESLRAKRMELGIQEGELFVVFPARFDGLKGHDVLLKALERLGDSVAAFKILLAGDGPQFEVLKSLAERSGVHGSLIFGGYRSDIEMLYSACDFVILPSLYEGLPFSLLEAMVCKKPVLGTDVGGVRKLVGEDGAGLIVEPGNAQALAEALRGFMAEGKQALQKRGEIAFERVMRAYSAEKMRQQTYSCYQEGAH